MPPSLGAVAAVAAGGLYAMALKSDGTVVAWGSGDVSQNAVPTGLSGITAISGGAYHCLALKSDGTVVAWGAGSTNYPDGSVDDGQSIVPAGLRNVVAISAGALHSLALKSDGTVVAWGAGEPDSPSDPFGFGQSTVPPGLSGVIAIAAGGWNSVALVGGPVLTPPALQPGGSAQLTLEGIAGWSYTVSASAGLVNWTPLASFVATKAATQIVDPAAGNFNRRFYRAVAP